jgi:hypothetical protein
MLSENKDSINHFFQPRSKQQNSLNSLTSVASSTSSSSPPLTSSVTSSGTVQHSKELHSCSMYVPKASGKYMSRQNELAKHFFDSKEPLGINKNKNFTVAFSSTS